MATLMGRVGGREPRLRVSGESVAVRAWIVGTVVAVCLIGINAWPMLAIDGAYAMLALAAAVGWGAWPTTWLGYGRAPAARQGCIALALGLGITSTLTLVLGLNSWLDPTIGWGVVIAGGVLGMGRLYIAQAQPKRDDGVDDDEMPTAPLTPRLTLRRRVVQALVILVLAWPTGLMLVGATLPPGVLWMEEGQGYDVLEYHLQAPREYFDAGAIHFLPHNVYAAFPQQMETQYLLLMLLVGDAHDAGISAQLLHALLGIATVLALAAWARRGWSDLLVAVMAGSTPWLAYLGCLAYVELGMLFFAAVALGVLSEHYRAEPASAARWQAVLVAGVCAGLATGCKYTAGALVAASLGLAYLLTTSGTWRKRGFEFVLFGAAAAVAFSPWLIRNEILTGNPVYPFGYEWFGGEAWSEAQATQWATGHAMNETVGGAWPSLVVGWRELMASGMFGPALFALALGGLIARRDRYAGLLALWTALILAAWAGLTHMPGRFAVVAIVPLAVAAGRLIEWPTRHDGDQPKATHEDPPRWLRSPVLLIAVAGAVLNGNVLWQKWQRESHLWGMNVANLSGATPVLLGEAAPKIPGREPVNWLTPDDAYVWIVGQADVFYVDRACHYTVVFNRDPWVELAENGASAGECVDWLRSRNVTHVVFSWAEIQRLAATYGFSPQVTPEWVTRLRAAGLSRVPGVQRPNYEILAVPAKR